jgi:hypothetical protein
MKLQTPMNNNMAYSANDSDNNNMKAYNANNNRAYSANSDSNLNDRDL